MEGTGSDQVRMAIRQQACRKSSWTVALQIMMGFEVKVGSRLQ